MWIKKHNLKVMDPNRITETGQSMHLLVHHGKGNFSDTPFSLQSKLARLLSNISTFLTILFHGSSAHPVSTLAREILDSTANELQKF